jgi:hypothetical protein
LRSLNGWWRLWVVTVVIFIGIATAVALGERDVFQENPPSSCVPSTLEANEGTRNAKSIWEALQATPADELSKGRIDNSTVTYTTYSCVSWILMLKYWSVALALAASILCVIYVIQWIAGGFRKSER